MNYLITILLCFDRLNCKIACVQYLIREYLCFYYMMFHLIQKESVKFKFTKTLIIKLYY